MFEFANQTNIESDHDRPDGLWISGFALRSPCGLTSAEAAEIEHCYTTPWDAILAFTSIVSRTMAIDVPFGSQFAQS